MTVVNSDVRTFIRNETDFRPHLDTEPYRDFSIGQDGVSEHAHPVFAPKRVKLGRGYIKVK